MAAGARIGTTLPGPSTQAPQSARRIWTLFAWVFASAAVESAFGVLLSPYLVAEWRLEEAAIGSVMAVFAVVSLLARLPVGALFTGARAPALLVIGSLLSASAFALLPVAGSVAAVTLLLGVNGLGWSVATTTQLALVLAWRPQRMSTASALSWYAAFAGLGHTASAVGGYLADRIGFDTTFVVLGAVTLAAVLLLLWALPRSADEIDEALPRRGPRWSRARLRGLPIAVWSSVLLMVYINFNLDMVRTFHPIMVVGAGLTLTQVGALYGILAGGSTVIRFGAGALFSRTGADAARLNTPLVVVGTAVTMLLPLFRGSFLLQIPLFAGMGMSRGLLRVTASTEAFAAVDDADESTRGTVAALLHSGLDLGRIAGPPVAGIVAQLAGVATMFWVLPVGLLSAYLLLRAAARRSPAPS